MKKLLIIFILFSCLKSEAQNRIYGNGFFNIRSNKFGWFGTGGTDTVGYVDSLKVKWLKPVLPGSYTTSGSPAAADFSGYIIWNTDSLKHQYSNGSSWLNLPGTGGGGGATALSGLTDVNISSPANGHMLVFRTSDNKWHNEAFSLGSAFVNGLNTFGANATLGLTDAFTLSVRTNNTDRIVVPATTGQITIPNNQVKFGSTGTNGYAAFARSSDGVTIGEITVSGSTLTINSVGGTTNLQAGGATINTSGGSGFNAGGGAVPTNIRLRISAGSTTIAQTLWDATSNTHSTLAAGQMRYSGSRWIGVPTSTTEREFTMNESALTATRIPFVSANGNLDHAAALSWDNSNTLIRLGGTTSSFPSLGINGANLRARLADNSANTDLEVLDEAYSESAWNGNLEVPTKNAIRDKIESLSGGSGITSINSQTGPAVTLTAINGLTRTNTTNNVEYKLGGTALSESTIIPGGNQTLALGEAANKLNGLVVQSSGLIQLFGLLQLNSESGTDANFSSSNNPGFIRLPTITAGRTVTLSPSDGAGKLVIIWNENSSGNNWSFTNTVIDAAGTTITNLTNDTVYILLNTGTGWLKIN